MSIRLTVVMVHTHSPSAMAERMAEEIVGELIAIHGVDLTLVGRLAELQHSSTDRLTLDSISGDCAVLDWHHPEQTRDTLARLGLAGVRARHAGDPEAGVPPAGKRRMYLFDLNRYSRGREVVEALIGLQKIRQTQTFSIAVPSGNGVSGAKHAAGGQVRGPNSGDAQTRVPAAGENAAATTSPSPQPPSRVHPTIDLDGLLDELDQLDP